MKDVSPELEHTLIQRAQHRYPNVLPYHNWDHALDVINAAETIAAQSIHPEVVDNKALLTIAAAWHDADYYLPSPDAFYTTREMRSAALAFGQLAELSEDQRYMIAQAIIDTTVDVHPKNSVLGEALHLADLGYFAASTDHFMHRLTLMREEWGNPAWEHTVKRTKKFGKHMLQESHKALHVILPTDAADAWTDSVKNNLSVLSQKFEAGELLDTPAA